jgi:MFS family permease
VRETPALGGSKLWGTGNAANIPSIGFSHAYSYFNLSFSVGAFIGPLIAGNVLEGLGIEKGWYTVVGISVLFFLIPVPFVWWAYPAWRNPFSKKQEASKVEQAEDMKEETLEPQAEA